MSWMVKFVEWPHQIKNNNNTDLRNTLTRNFFNAKLWLLVRSQAGSWLKILLLSTVHTRCLITFISLDTPVYHLPDVYVLTQPLLFENSKYATHALLIPRNAPGGKWHTKFSSINSQVWGDVWWDQEFSLCSFYFLNFNVHSWIQ